MELGLPSLVPSSAALPLLQHKQASGAHCYRICRHKESFWLIEYSYFDSWSSQPYIAKKNFCFIQNILSSSIFWVQSSMHAHWVCSMQTSHSDQESVLQFCSRIWMERWGHFNVHWSAAPESGGPREVLFLTLVWGNVSSSSSSSNSQPKVCKNWPIKQALYWPSLSS